MTYEFEKIYKKDHSIRDLSTFTALFCLSVNVRDLKVSPGLGKIINLALSLERGTIESLMMFTGFIVAEAAGKESGIDITKSKEFDSNRLDIAMSLAKEKSIIEVVRGLMESHILNEESYEFIKGPLINVVKQWIDKAYFIDIIKDLEDPEEIRYICFNLIKESFILTEFWKYDYRLKTPFFNLIREEYLLGFPQEIIRFAQMSYYLLGDKDNDFTANTIDFLRNFDSLVIPLDRNHRSSSKNKSLIQKKAF